MHDSQRLDSIKVENNKLAEIASINDKIELNTSVDIVNPDNKQPEIKITEPGIPYNSSSSDDDSLLNEPTE